MPTYEYECKKCSHRFEKFQSMTADPLKTCPKCKGPVKRLIGSGMGVIFKGSGFYATDYRKPDYSKKKSKHCISEGDAPPCCGEGGTCPKKESE